jgi:methionine synthase II (cobalamin-independent)
VFFVERDRAAVEPVYERALFGEVARIVSAIPHEHLAIQWDTAVEFGFLEHVEIAGVRLAPWWDDVLDGIVERAARQAAQVTEDVALGFHLCYGDVEETHFVQPKDAGHLAAVLSGILAASPRRVDWVHLPVPIERDDAAYFAPLAAVTVPEATQLVLGLVHHEDGVEGGLRRIEAASSVVKRFGVATECGFGRGPAERTAPLLDLHRAIIEAAG